MIHVLWLVITFNPCYCVNHSLQLAQTPFSKIRRKIGYAIWSQNTQKKKLRKRCNAQGWMENVSLRKWNHHYQKSSAESGRLFKACSAFFIHLHFALSFYLGLRFILSIKNLHPFSTLPFISRFMYWIAPLNMQSFRELCPKQFISVSFIVSSIIGTWTDCPVLFAIFWLNHWSNEFRRPTRFVPGTIKVLLQ